MSPLDAFLEAYWKDRDAGSVQPLAEYLARFPGDDLAIAGEFVALESGNESSATLPADGKDRFGPYHLQRSIGRGGQGEVFLAEDTRLRRKVALKLLTNLGPVSDALARRFRREAEVASRIEHPGICTVYEAGEVDGTLFIAMQYVEGDTLRDRITDAVDRRRKGAIKLDSTDTKPSDDDSTTRHDVVAVVRLFEGIARAAHAAHEHGIIHRDLKPANIMVQPDGNPVILDFGLAREIQDDRHALTVTGDFFGTPAYMAPEQLRDERHAPDPRTDNYALGVTLYECLTLNRPFDGATRESLFHDILTSTAPDPRRQNGQIPSDLATVLTIALEKDPNHRYASAAALAQDLRLISERKPIRGRPVGTVLRIKRWTQRNPALALTLLGLTIALAVALWQLDAKNGALNEARTERDRNFAFSIASGSRTATKTNPGLGLALAVEAHTKLPNPETTGALYEALHRLREIATIRIPTPVNVAAEFSPDGQRVLTHDADGHTRVWDIASGNQLQYFTKPHSFSVKGNLVRGRSNRVQRAAVTGSGNRLEVSNDGTELPWTGEPVSAYDVGSRLVAVGTPSGRINVWQIDNANRGSTELGGHESAVKFLRFDSTEGRLLSLGADGTLRIWALADTLYGDVRVEHHIDLDREATSTSDDGTILGYQDPDGNAIIVDVRNGRSERLGVRGRVFVSTDGEVAMVVNQREGTASIWDLHSVARKPVSIRAPKPINEASANRARNLVITGHTDGTVSAFNLDSGTLRWSERRHGTAVTSIAFGPKPYIASASDDGTARIWNDRDGADVATLPGAKASVVWPIRYVPSASRWISASGKTAQTWHVDGRPDRRVEARTEVVDAHLAPGGATLAAVEAAGVTLSPAVENEIRSDGLSELDAIGFDRTGRRFVFYDRDSVDIHDTGTGALIATLPVPNLVAAHLALIENAEHVVTLSSDGILRRWPVDVAEAGRARARELTAQERTRFRLTP